ncbi:MAG: hypothetical protein P8048_02365 [Calditrichia bacterium]
MLNSSKYGNLEVPARLIYEELKRAKLNRRKQRERFVQRGGKRRLKPPGTPLLTLDGEVMVGFRSEDQEAAPNIFTVKAPVSSTSGKEKILTVRGNKSNSSSNNNEDKEKVEAAEESSDGNHERNSLDRDVTVDNSNLTEEVEKKEREVD